MCISKAFVGYCSLALGVVLFALVVGTTSARTAPAEPDAGQEPPSNPVFYNLTPAKGENIAQVELSRAAATIETRRDASVSWAGLYVDGQRRHSDLMGPTPHQQTISTDIGDLGPGTHVVRVKAVDSDGLVGGYVWQFTVV
jgi:hypothetical protein